MLNLCSFTYCLKGRLVSIPSSHLCSPSTSKHIHFPRTIPHPHLSPRASMSFAARTAARSVRVVRAPIRTNSRQIRFASTEPNVNSKAAAAGGSSGFVGGLAGGALVFAVSRPVPNFVPIGNCRLSMLQRSKTYGISSSDMATIEPAVQSQLSIAHTVPRNSSRKSLLL